MKTVLPTYLRIADELRARLLPLPVGTPFDTEQALTKEFGVARGTIRQALDILVHEGILTRAQGSGSFRAQPIMSPYRLTLTQELTDSIRKVNKNSVIHNLSITHIPATPAVADQLHIPHGTKVTKVTRIRLIGSRPFAYCEGYLRTDNVPVFYKRDYVTSLSDLVRTRLKLHIRSRHCDLCAAVADETVAQALDIPIGLPVLKVTVSCRGYDNEPFLTDTFYFPSWQTLHFDI